jgi:hypothetical protein
MISRLTLSAVIFAIIGTASLAFAATVRHPTIEAQAAAKPVRIVQLERVVITAKRAQ